VGLLFFYKGSTEIEDLFLGSCFGFLALFAYQLKRFSHIMAESRSKLSTTSVVLGFDGSKTYLLFFTDFYGIQGGLLPRILPWFRVGSYFSGSWIF
jgi:hypothetical protein